MCFLEVTSLNKSGHSISVAGWDVPKYYFLHSEEYVRKEHSFLITLKNDEEILIFSDS